MRVLIVEDSIAARRMLCSALKDMGAKEILEAGDGKAALEILARSPAVNLIVTDWHMPEMSGFELLKEVRKSLKHKNTPIIMTTAETNGENVVAALREGATNYMIKPFSRKDLDDKIGPLIKSFIAEKGSGSAVAQSGVVKQGELGSLFQYFMQTRQTGCCDLEYATCTGRVSFNDGQITGALYQLQRGEAAFFTCMSKQPKRYTFRTGEVSVPRDCVITRSSMALLLEAITRNDAAQRT